MAKFAAILFAAFAFQAAFVAPKKNQGQQGGSQPTPIEQVANQVQTVVNDVSASLQKELPDQKQFTETLAANSQQFVKDVEGIIEKLHAEVDKNNGSTDTVLQQVTDKFTENIIALKHAVSPDTTARGNDIITKLDNHFKNSAAEVGKLVNFVQPNLEQAGETVNTFAKGILGDFLNLAEDFKTLVDNSINGKRAKN